MTTADPAASRSPLPGTIAWHDLTVPNADQLRDFYQDVVGWTSEPHEMGGYADYSMKDTTGQTVAGVCHAQGINADIPAAWLMYIIVADLDQSIARAAARGGKIISGPRALGTSRFCVLQDPAGAYVALYQT